MNEPSREYMVNVRRLSFHVAEWGDPRNVPVLLLHGRSASAIDLQHLAASLADRYRVVAFDQRGHGLSDWPGRYTHRLLQADVEGVAKVIGMEKFALIGHSMGGGLAWAYAARHPEDVRCLVILDASPEPPGVHEPNEPSPQTPAGLTTPEEIITWAAALGWAKRIGRQDLGRWLTRYARRGPDGTYVAGFDEPGYNRAYDSGHMRPSNRTDWRTISRITCPTWSWSVSTGSWAGSSGGCWRSVSASASSWSSLAPVMPCTSKTCRPRSPQSARSSPPTCRNPQFRPTGRLAEGRRRARWTRSS